MFYQYEYFLNFSQIILEMEITVCRFVCLLVLDNVEAECSRFGVKNSINSRIEILV